MTGRHVSYTHLDVYKRQVKNLALIEEENVDFEEGLNILSGETGAGKSIILGSINAALGAKTSPDFIRTGADVYKRQG